MIRRLFQGGSESFPSTLNDLREGSHCLALYRSENGDIIGSGGIKKPSAVRKGNIFSRARSLYSPEEFEMEIGWIHSPQGEEGEAILDSIVGGLIEYAGSTKLYCITLSDDMRLIPVLKDHRFRKAGTEIPSSRGDHSFNLYVRE
ncbi:MAG: hypothetical protein QCI82_10110 [Candidatus Thermoplasmatota archaeon]|nr:hypothetical protein [Candidatus Thermoplasmatota archaeon]